MIQVTGVNELRIALAAQPKRFQRALSGALKEVSFKVLQSARSKINVSDKDKPHLRDMLRVTVRQLSDTVITANISNAHELWIEAMALEFGTQKMSARPFLRPALEENTPEAMRVITQSLQRVIEDQSASESVGIGEGIADGLGEIAEALLIL